MSTIADKLTSLMDTKTQIKEAITRKGGVVTENMPFSNYPSAIDGLNVLPATTPSYDWSPNPTWWDIEQILTDDVNATYPYSYIVLFKDTYATTTLNGAGAYRTSDGAYYTSSTTHIWDTTKDKDCNEGYKTRWIIYYFSSSYVYQIILPTLSAIGVVLNVDLTSQFERTGTVASVTPFTNNSWSGWWLDLNFMSLINGHTFSLNYDTYPYDFFTYAAVTQKWCKMRTGKRLKNNGSSSYRITQDFIKNFKGTSLEIEVNTAGGNEMAFDGSSNLSYSLYSFCTNSYIKSLKITRNTENILYETPTSKNYPAYCVFGMSRTSSPQDAPSEYSALVHLEVDPNLLWNIVDFKYYFNLSLTSLRTMINAIQDNAGKPAKAFIINSTLNDKLTTADKLLIASKNWSLSVQ